MIGKLQFTFYISRGYSLPKITINNNNNNNNGISVESTGWLFSPLFPGRIGIWKCWFLRREENRSTRRKTLGAGTRTNNKLNPHMTPSPGIKPGPHWWEAVWEANAQPLRHPCSPRYVHFDPCFCTFLRFYRTHNKIYLLLYFAFEETSLSGPLWVNSNSPLTQTYFTFSWLKFTTTTQTQSTLEKPVRQNIS